MRSAPSAAVFRVVLLVAVATTVYVTPVECVKESEQSEWHNIERDWNNPQHCHLKLVCAIAAAKDPGLEHEDFLRGIRLLSERRRNYVSYQLAAALRAGESGRSCHKVAPLCQLAEEDLLDAVHDVVPGQAGRGRWKRQATGYGGHYGPRQPATGQRRYWENYNRRQQQQQRPPQRRPSTMTRMNRVISSMLRRLPPIMRPDGAATRGVCQTCDARRTACTVYSIGTYAGCTGMWLVAGLPGQVACNVATAPGSMGCAYNTWTCFNSGCGLVVVDLPTGGTGDPAARRPQQQQFQQQPPQAQRGGRGRPPPGPQQTANDPLSFLTDTTHHLMSMVGDVMHDVMLG